MKEKLFFLLLFVSVGTVTKRFQIVTDVRGNGPYQRIYIAIYHWIVAIKRHASDHETRTASNQFYSKAGRDLDRLRSRLRDLVQAWLLGNPFVIKGLSRKRKKKETD